MSDDTPRDWEELKKLAEAAKFFEPLQVDYHCQRTGLDDERLYAFLMHGDSDDGEFVCVDEEPTERDGPPSPRLEFIAALVNAWPKVLELIAEVERLRANFKTVDEALSNVCDERDEAYDLNGKLQKDIDEITSANSDLAGWSKAKDEQLSQLKAERDRMAEALAILEPKKPADDPKDGPCCHEQTEEGFWICTGCTCQNYGDAQNAALWADAMNRWIEWNNLTQKPGEKPMTNASEITARDAALLFRNPTHFSELLEAFEASAETDTAGKLDDALKSVARRSALNTGDLKMTNVINELKFLRAIAPPHFFWTGGPDQTEDPEWIVEMIRSGDATFENVGTPEVEMHLFCGREGYADCVAKPGDLIVKSGDGAYALHQERGGDVALRRSALNTGEKTDGC